jgi:hypothetical protein
VTRSPAKCFAGIRDITEIPPITYRAVVRFSRAKLMVAGRRKGVVLLTRYDLLARSAFVRVVLSSRRKFVSMTVLTWAEGISRVMRSLIETLGEPIEVLTDYHAFETRLLRDVPLG